MRKLSEITRRIVPISELAQPNARRQVRSVFNSLTCLVLVKHAENEGQIQVSDDGDAVGAVWINRSPVMIDWRDFGKFIVVQMTHQMAREKNLKVLKLFDTEKMLPEERAQFRAAAEAASRTRQRLMYGDRKGELHPNATA